MCVCVCLVVVSNVLLAPAPARVHHNPAAARIGKILKSSAVGPHSSPKTHSRSYPDACRTERMLGTRVAGELYRISGRVNLPLPGICPIAALGDGQKGPIPTHRTALAGFPAALRRSSQESSPEKVPFLRFLFNNVDFLKANHWLCKAQERKLLVPLIRKAKS